MSSDPTKALASSKHLVAPNGALGLHKLAIPRKWYKAAILVADGLMTFDAIAKEIGITAMTLRSWKRKPAFQQIVASYHKHVRDELLSEGLAQKHNRIRGMNQRYRELREVVAKRAAEAKTPESLVHHVPGADTGWVVVDKAEVVGEGENARVQVLEVKVDNATAKTLLEIEQNAAKEMGGGFESEPAGGAVDGDRPSVIINFPVLSAEDMKAVENAVVIDLPVTGKRMLTRPSDGKPR